MRSLRGVCGLAKLGIGWQFGKSEKYENIKNILEAVVWI